MASNFNQFNNRWISERSKNTVYGFIRKIEQLFDKNKTYYIMPIDIKFICAVYYHGDVFDENEMSDNLELNKNNQNIVTVKTKKWGTIWLKNIVYKGINEWTFKILKSNMKDHGDFDFGIAIHDKSVYKLEDSSFGTWIDKNILWGNSDKQNKSTFRKDGYNTDRQHHI